MIARIVSGAKWAAFALFINAVVLSGGTYASACMRQGLNQCNLDRGIAWILTHPVFPFSITAMTVLGFIFGAVEKDFIGEHGPLAAVCARLAIFGYICAYLVWSWFSAFGT